MDLWNADRADRAIVHIDLSAWGARCRGGAGQGGAGHAPAHPAYAPPLPPQPSWCHACHSPCCKLTTPPFDTSTAPAVLDNEYVPAVEVVGNIGNSLRALAAQLKARAA